MSFNIRICVFPTKLLAFIATKSLATLDTKDREVRLLDTIAIALTIGNVFAASFDKRQHIQLVLEKNRPPTPENVSAANELIYLIGTPTIEVAIVDLFHYPIRRCGANIDKQIHNLHTSTQDAEFRNDFMLALQAYSPGAGILVEVCVDEVPPFVTVYGILLNWITNRTAQGLNAVGVLASRKKYTDLFLLAEALGGLVF